MEICFVYISFWIDYRYFFYFSGGFTGYASLSGLDVNGGFKVTPGLLKIMVKSNGSYEGSIRITNLHNTESEFKINFSNMKNSVLINERDFNVSAGRSKNINIKFLGVDPGVYTGVLDIYNGQIKKSIPIILEIESRKIMFDSSVNIFPKGYFFPGDKFNVEIKIFDLTKPGSSNISITYFIKNFKNKVILNESEVIIISNSVIFTKSFKLPYDLKEGNYLFGVLLNYENSLSVSAN